MALKGSKTEDNLKHAFAGESQANREIADWFETLAKAERSHATRFHKALDTL